MRYAISSLGFEPRQRNVHYDLFDSKHEAFAVEANRDWVKRKKAEDKQAALVQLG